MKNKILRKLSVLFLAAALMVPAVSVSMPAATVQAATSTTYTVKLTKVTDSVAKKVYKKLMAGQKVVFKFNTTYANLNLFGKLKDRIAKKYAYGVCPDFETTDTTVCISAKQAKTFAREVKAAKKKAADQKAYIEQVNASAISAGSEELAKSIHDTLMTKTPYTFYTKGKPAAVCDDLIRRIQKINKQDVLFKYDAEKVDGTDCYEVVIDNEHAEAYYWAVSFSKREFDEYKEGSLGALKSNIKIFGDDPDDPEVYAWYYNQLPKAQRIILESDNFGDLSDIVKLYMITGCCPFDCFTDNGITYSKISSEWTPTNNEAVVLKNLYNSTAYGVCQHFAESEIILFSYWGIDAKFCHSDIHAWTEGVAANSKGEMIRYKFDYKLYTMSANETEYGLGLSERDL